VAEYLNKCYNLHFSCHAMLFLYPFIVIYPNNKNLKIMKKLLIAAFTLMIVTGASATVKPHFSNGTFQRGFGGGGLKGGRTTVVVGGYAPYYAPYYSPYVGLGLGFGFGYPWYGYYPYPYYDYGYGYNPRPSRLDREIMAIQHDYDQKIRSARARHIFINSTGYANTGNIKFIGKFLCSSKTTKMIV
jgi:hypothetical protein